MQAVLSAMRRQRFGRIVNISSGTTAMVIPGAGAYAASKSAVNMISAVAREELEGAGVSVTPQPS
jgi:short-subunit dehydrogenase